MRARTNCLRLQLPQTDIQSASVVKAKSDRGGANVSEELEPLRCRFDPEKQAGLSVMFRLTLGETTMTKTNNVHPTPSGNGH